MLVRSERWSLWRRKGTKAIWVKKVCLKPSMIARADFYSLISSMQWIILFRRNLWNITVKFHWQTIHLCELYVKYWVVTQEVTGETGTKCFMVLRTSNLSACVVGNHFHPLAPNVYTRFQWHLDLSRTSSGTWHPSPCYHNNMFPF